MQLATCAVKLECVCVCAVVVIVVVVVLAAAVVVVVILHSHRTSDTDQIESFSQTVVGKPLTLVCSDILQINVNFKF